MAAHSFMEIGESLLLACGQSYLPDLAAVFTESELRDEGERYGYVSRVDQLRDRLQLQGSRPSVPWTIWRRLSGSGMTGIQTRKPTPWVYPYGTQPRCYTS